MEYLSVQNYAKKYGLKRGTIYYNLGKKNGIIPRENIKIISVDKVMILDIAPLNKDNT